MQSLFYLFCAVCVVIWLIGWVVLIAEQKTQKYASKINNWISKMSSRYGKWFCLLIVMSTVSGCTTTGNVEIRRVCPPMLRAATYNAMQADELADYRIAVEQCKGGIK